MGQSFKDLVAWQRSIELTVDVYRFTSKFPESERFGLTNQMRRASVSIASNIAEGYGRATKGEYVQFLGYARGSCSELETQIVIAKKLGFGILLDLDSTESHCNDVSRLLGALMKSIRSKQSQNPQSLSPLIP
jgi:four helix bundle protein